MTPPPAPDYEADLLPRLERVDSGPSSNGICTNWHRNPDGPEAAAAIRTLVEERDRLREAGESVVARWDTPWWKDIEPTAHVVNRLRAALSGREG